VLMYSLYLTVQDATHHGTDVMCILLQGGNSLDSLHITIHGSSHHGSMSHVFGCRVAVAGKLWGPALLLARHCSDKAFLETAAAMAEGSTTMGSPLHTLTLLMSGKADAVHAVPAEPGSDSNSKQQAGGAAVASVQYGSPFAQPVQTDAGGVLSQWRGNLAIIAANRVAGEEAAMVKLGDRLWQERSQVCSCKCPAFACLQPAHHFCSWPRPEMRVILVFAT